MKILNGPATVIASLLRQTTRQKAGKVQKMMMQSQETCLWSYIAAFGEKMLDVCGAQHQILFLEEGSFFYGQIPFLEEGKNFKPNL